MENIWKHSYVANLSLKPKLVQKRKLINKDANIWNKYNDWEGFIAGIQWLFHIKKRIKALLHNNKLKGKILYIQPSFLTSGKEQFLNSVILA